MLQLNFEKCTDTQSLSRHKSQGSCEVWKIGRQLSETGTDTSLSCMKAFKAYFLLAIHLIFSSDYIVFATPVTTKQDMILESHGIAVQSSVILQKH